MLLSQHIYVDMCHYHTHFVSICQKRTKNSCFFLVMPWAQETKCKTNLSGVSNRQCTVKNEPTDQSILLSLIWNREDKLWYINVLLHFCIETQYFLVFFLVFYSLSQIYTLPPPPPPPPLQGTDWDKQSESMRL